MFSQTRQINERRRAAAGFYVMNDDGPTSTSKKVTRVIPRRSIVIRFRVREMIALDDPR